MWHHGSNRGVDKMSQKRSYDLKKSSQSVKNNLAIINIMVYGGVKCLGVKWRGSPTLFVFAPH